MGDARHTPGRAILGEARDHLLGGLALPKDSPPSVVAVESFTQLYAAPGPLGTHVGDVRIRHTAHQTERYTLRIPQRSRRGESCARVC
jgi:hypothetical protein